MSDDKRQSYVYVIFRPNGAPCYVGKGQGGRWLSHVRRSHNAHLARIYANAGGDLPIVKVREELTDAEAVATEIALISAIGRAKHGGPLVNLTDGGDGKTGWVPSSITRDRIRIANTGKKATDAQRLKMSNARAGRPKSEAHAKRIGDAHRGKPKSPAMMEKLIAVRQTDEYRAASRERAKRYHEGLTEEEKTLRRERISAATKAGMADPAVRAKVSAAAKKRLNPERNFLGRGAQCQKSPSTEAS